MLRGVTALLEAIDERAERHARQVAEEKKNDRDGSFPLTGNSAAQQSVAGDLSVDMAPSLTDAGLGPMRLPTFPAPPFPVRSSAAPAGQDESNTTSLKAWSHIERDAVAAVAEFAEKEDDASIMKLKDEEIEALTNSLRHHRAATEVTRKELLERSLRVHQLEEALREMEMQFKEHKTKSHLLMKQKQREYEALLSRFENENECGSKCQKRGDCMKGIGSCEEGNGAEEVVTTGAQEDVNDLENDTRALRQERDWLRAQLTSCQRELDDALQSVQVATQEVDFLRLDLRGAQEALESEVSAHQRSKALLQRRQHELNDLRSAVEKNGGTFTTSGALVTLRGDGGREGDVVILSRQLLEKQKALEEAMRDASEWRRRCERVTHKLEEERTTRVSVHVPQTVHDPEETYHVRIHRMKHNDAASHWVRGIFAVVDTVALYVGRQLRRSPMLRICSVLYFVCLHVVIAIIPFMFIS
uniref:Golgin-84 n=1 Tax=Trypanosoma congolense (strain IL3000) TaxID=1068625 RepID=G0UVA7_TRYCI|nr:conserved hypothetical protein [Trypanosoma congolense IL3000]